jgi:hypothetical protein
MSSHIKQDALTFVFHETYECMLESQYFIIHVTRVACSGLSTIISRFTIHEKNHARAHVKTSL